MVHPADGCCVPWLQGHAALCAAGRGLLASQPVQALLLTVYIFPRPQGTLLELSLGHEPEPRQSGRPLVAAATFGVHS